MDASNLIAFPERNKGRKRRVKSPFAMGHITLNWIEAQGGMVPANVAKIYSREEQAKRAEYVPLPERSPELSFCLALYCSLHEKRRRVVRGQLLLLREHEATTGRDTAARILNLLEGQ